MTLMLREIRQSGAINVKGFLVRRIIRLWPLYYVMLLAEAALVFVAQIYSPDNQTLFADKFVCYVLYCSNWLETSGQGPFFVSWSLAVEEQFYLFLSFLLLFLRPKLVVVVFAALLVMKVALVNWVQLDIAALPWRVILSYSEAILLGVLLAYFLNGRRRYAWFNIFASSRYTPAMLLVIFGGFLVAGQLDNKSDLNALTFYLVCTLLVGVYAVIDKLPIIGGKTLSLIGLLSYGIYLMHMPVLSAVKRFTTEPMLVMMLTLAIVLPLAWASYSFFEEPIRRLGRRKAQSLTINRQQASIVPSK